MNQQKPDLSYFSLRLTELLSVSFPEKRQDQKFILLRSQLAESAYENAFKEGHSVSYCTEIAESILFEELTFSRYDLIFKVICNEFSLVLADEEIQPLVLKMLTECKSVFSGYHLTKEFEESSDYNILYSELTGNIQIWIEEHGLQ
ncbi:DUF1896 family protein [Chryseobacterium wangxinyae]|uniref:DUF1896 family protein n=1 Tax=Chryseobacterium sp. CY353 TaxID=2997334 RepID=UPI002271C1C1|nr:DUF1896 family protein [Chryseobacterium sp. CY353]MCY0969897.1 DUF1896 family protein [Chryseobacterium sp. CY353]MCY0970941.1 DUF1896 family protein [Chryseobacterium sp. CY353]